MSDDDLHRQPERVTRRLVPTPPVLVTDAVAIETRGYGLKGIVTCLTCGAALLLDAEVDVLALHGAWHRREVPDVL